MNCRLRKKFTVPIPFLSKTFTTNSAISNTSTFSMSHAVCFTEVYCKMYLWRLETAASFTFCCPKTGALNVDFNSVAKITSYLFETCCEREFLTIFNWCIRCTLTSHTNVTPVSELQVITDNNSSVLLKVEHRMYCALECKAYILLSKKKKNSKCQNRFCNIVKQESVFVIHIDCNPKTKIAWSHFPAYIHTTISLLIRKPEAKRHAIGFIVAPHCQYVFASKSTWA